MKHGELITALNRLNSQLVDIIAALGETPTSETPPDAGMCPIHHVPWRKYNWGWAHPPTKAGEKWCRREKQY